MFNLHPQIYIFRTTYKRIIRSYFLMTKSHRFFSIKKAARGIMRLLELLSDPNGIRTRTATLKGL